MTEVFFYHLTRRALEETLPDLLQKTIDRKWRAVVRLGSAERVEAMNIALWTANRSGFLPHGSQADFAKSESKRARQPVWLTDGTDNPNKAEVLFLVDGASAEGADMGTYARVCDLFDGNDEEALAAARERWKTSLAFCKADEHAGHKLVYWQQTDRSWEKKLEAN